MRAAPADATACMTAFAAPPAPRIRTVRSDASIWLVTAAPSVDDPSTRPSATTSVFTDPAAAATSSSSSQWSVTCSLCGIVTFAPAKPVATRPRTASPSRSGGVRSGTYVQSSPSASNAAFCIGGESECAVGQPSRPINVVVPLIEVT